MTPDLIWRRIFGKPAPHCVTQELVDISLSEAGSLTPVELGQAALLQSLATRLRANIPEAFLPKQHQSTVRAYIARLATPGTTAPPLARAIFAYDARDATIQARFECKSWLPRKRLVDIGPPLTPSDWLLLKMDMRPQAASWRKMNEAWIDEQSARVRDPACTGNDE